MLFIQLLLNLISARLFISTFCTLWVYKKNPFLLWLKRQNLTKERGSLNGYITGKTGKFQLKNDGV
mgnify:CR=1 FL=1